ncbi:MAG: hypothetical protein B7Y39_02035 [Bdellovibrio sp. 28-41-41]|nr:MAG: hypothetical protein B7Y39_02035 [Bdellovibrio sp. 28-41-41]
MNRYLFLILLLASTSWSKSVLIIGDSHACGSTGKTLFDSYLGKNFRVSLYCGVSSHPYHWIHGEAPKGFICQSRTGEGDKLSKCSEGGNYIPLQSILSKGPWDKVIAIMGTNSLNNHVADKNYDELSKDLQAVSSKCFWISPPNLRVDQAKAKKNGITKLQNNQDEFYNSLTTSVAKNCTLLDSRNYTTLGSAAAETSDGIHRTISAGQSWGSQLFDEIESK